MNGRRSLYDAGPMIALPFVCYVMFGAFGALGLAVRWVEDGMGALRDGVWQRGGVVVMALFLVATALYWIATRPRAGGAR